MSQRLRADLLLLFTALVWGVSFVFQRQAANQVGVFTLNSARFLIGGLVLLPFVLRMRVSKGMLGWAGLAGMLLVAGSALQQGGMQTTAAANASFITGLYVVFIPIILSLFLRHKVSKVVWLAICLSALGGFLLSVGGIQRFVIGDLLELLGAVMWALHVILVGSEARNYNPLQFACVQFLVAGLFNGGIALVGESHWIPALAQVWGAVLYLGIFATAVGFTLQVVGQRHAPTTDAALILGLEAPLAAVAGYIFLSESLTPVQWLGCACILGAVVWVQVSAVSLPLLSNPQHPNDPQGDHHQADGEAQHERPTAADRH
jgi:drug/metabolite transporter (DMT)-like permease